MKGTGWWIYLLVVILSSLHVSRSLNITICGLGQRLYKPYIGPQVCIWCPEGQFMPEEEHSHRQCYPCTAIENMQLEKLVSPCSRTHHTVIHCIDGYYRTQPSYPHDRGHCERCTECKFPKRKCQLYQDAVCCPGDDYGVYINKDGSPECVRECGAGQFLDGVNKRCLPCPQNSYMAERNHINNYCDDCEVPTSRKEKILQSCNATHSTVIGCVDGYSRSPSNTGRTGDTRCVKLCGRGQFLDLRTDTCLSCYENTYMDEDQHTHIDRCKSCKFPEPLLEKVLHPCNSTHPTVLGCAQGYYRRQQPHNLSTSSCVRCRKCSENTDGNIYDGRVCEQSRDTACCPQPGMSVVDALDGPLCMPKYIPVTVCGEDEYLSTDPSTTCLPCPKGTYMDQRNHTNTSCRGCDEFPHEKFCTAEGRNRINENDVNTGFLQAVILGVVLVVIAIVILLVFLMYRHLKEHKKIREWLGRKFRSQTAKRNNADERATPSNVVPESGMCLCELAGIIEWLGRKFHSQTAKRNKADEKATPSNGPESETLLQIDSETSENCEIKKDYISVKEFTNEHLPHPYRDDSMVEMIKFQAALTTLVTVDGISDQRPKLMSNVKIPYPYSDDKYRKTPHTGTGWVERVKMYRDQPCPCTVCKQSDFSRMSWGEVVICTATSVVFDIEEGKQCRCYFFYETDDIDLKSCPSVSNAMRVFKNIERNWCYVTFVTHDIHLTQILQQKFAKYHRLRREVQHKYKLVKYVTSFDEVQDKLIQLQANLTHSLDLLKNEIMEIQNLSNIYLEASHINITTAPNHGQQHPYRIFIALFNFTAISKEDDNNVKKLFTRLSTLHKKYSHCLNKIETFLKKVQDNKIEDSSMAVDKCRKLCAQVDELERYLSLILNIRNLIDNSAEKECPAYKQRYHDDHPLAVIVSHPKGRSQKICLGKVTDRNCSWHDNRCRYRYTNETCQGCEGARVFILGRAGIRDHNHSEKVGHQSESGEWSDIIPYLIDFSVTAQNNT